MNKTTFYILDFLYWATFSFYTNAFFVHQELVYSPARIGSAVFFALLMIAFRRIMGPFSFTRTNKKIKS